MVHSFVTSWSSSYTRSCASCQRGRKTNTEANNMKKENVLKIVLNWVLVFVVLNIVFSDFGEPSLFQRTHPQSDVIQLVALRSFS